MILIKKNNKEDPKSKVGDHIRTSKYKNVFSKGYVPNWSMKRFLWLKKVKILLREHILSVILMKKNLSECFTKEIAKTNQTEFSVKKGTKRKGAKLYVKWKKMQ